MATANPTHGLHSTSSLIKRASGWLIAIGVLFVVLGLLAIAEPLIAGLAIAFLVGYSVDVFFAFLESMIQAFSRGREGRPPVQGTRSLSGK